MIYHRGWSRLQGPQDRCVDCWAGGPKVTAASLNPERARATFLLVGAPVSKLLNEWSNMHISMDICICLCIYIYRCIDI